MLKLPQETRGVSFVSTKETERIPQTLSFQKKAQGMESRETDQQGQATRAKQGRGVRGVRTVKPAQAGSCSMGAQSSATFG